MDRDTQFRSEMQRQLSFPEDDPIPRWRCRQIRDLYLRGVTPWSIAMHLRINFRTVYESLRGLNS